jgi:hypothetical protein
MTQIGFKDVSTKPQILTQTATNNLSQGFDSSLFKMTTGILPSTGTIHLRKTPNGAFTLPLQPCFLCYLAVDDVTVTGAGAVYTAGTNTSFTNVFNQGSHLTSLNPVTFLAPVTGRYLFALCLSFRGVTAATANLFSVRIVTSNATYRKDDAYMSKTSTFMGISMEQIVDMDALDTCTFQVSISGQVGNTADMDGSGTRFTYISGALVA